MHAAIAAAKKARVRVSVVSLAAEVHVARRARAAARPPAVCKPEGAAIQVASRLLRQAAEETGGSYGVSLDAEHLEQLLMAHAPPPPALADETASSLVLMGFPQRSGGAAHIRMAPLVADSNSLASRPAQKALRRRRGRRSEAMRLRKRGGRATRPQQSRAT